MASLLAFSAMSAAASAAEAPGLIFPFTEADNATFVSRPYFDASFLDFLERSGVDAVIDRDGLPLVYYSENGSFGCNGFCGNITMNGFTFGSKTMGAGGVPSALTVDESVVAGSEGISSFVDTADAIRLGLMDSPEALDEFEKYLLEQEEGYMRSAYYDELGDVWDQALGGIKGDPSVYGPLSGSVGSGDLAGAVAGMEDYIGKNFDVNSAYDMSSLYSALGEGKLGSVQAEELMRGVLDRMAEEGNVDLNLDDMGKFSDLMNTGEFGEMMDRASEVMKENPEMFDRLGDLTKEMMDTPETAEVLKKALEEAMEKGDWEAVKELMDVFSKMENKEELMKALTEGMAEHMRDMIESGQMDKLMQMMDDPALRDMLSEVSQSFSQGMLESAWEWLKNTPPELAYIVALAAIIATLLILVKLKM
ncbi:MAG: hypothetical protein V1813_03010 [Candidatus Aenigmatarchaeota archaeon]